MINWGNSKLPDWLPKFPNVLNNPQGVALAISKVKSYERFKAVGVPTVDFTTDPNEAAGWLSGGSRILARRDGRSGGDGIRILEPGHGTIGADEADFFTKYYPKNFEYRVHVGPSAYRVQQTSGPYAGPETPVPMWHQVLCSAGGVQHEGMQEGQAVHQGRVIDITQKKKSVVGADGEHRTVHQRIVRSHGNGWIFAHEALFLPDNLRTALSHAAVAAVSSLGLDFGAVDVAVRAPDKIYLDLKVLEVNTAPGLESQKTVNAYINCLKELIA
jgi:hypothetical protein